MQENPQARLSMLMFLLNEVEIEVNKLAAPQLTIKARQTIAESVLKKIHGINGELNELIEELNTNDEDEGQPIEGEDVIIEGEED